jgi:hypothetical protein
MVDGESALNMTISRSRRFQHIIIVAALIAPLLSFTTAPAHAVAATCAEGGVCQVGDIGPGGGIVFYVASTTFTQIGASGTMCTTNCKYLEVARLSIWGVNSADPALSWTISANQSSAVTGADGTAIGSGYQNSVDILNQSGAVIASSTAATAARAFTGGSKSDWFLPSKDELNQLYLQKTAVGDFGNNYYWSSSESQDIESFAWGQNFGVGLQSAGFKGVGDYVRPVRAFAPATKISITRAAVGAQRRTAFTTQPQVTIQYTNNDTVTVSSAIVTATISSGGTLIGTTTATASAGVATFSNLGVDGTIGTTYTISYTALDLPVASATVTLTGTNCDGSTFTCQVGDIGPGGGKIFYVAPTTFTQLGATGFMCSTACKYLEAAPTSGTSAWTDATYEWSGNTNTRIGTTGAAIGTGYKNTVAMVAQSNTTGKAGTATLAYRGPSNLSDWFLPSQEEWVEMEKVKTLLQLSTLNAYWSSTEDPSESGDAIFLYFGVGLVLTKAKSNAYLVRPIRAFGTAPTQAPVAVAIAPTPVPYLKTLTTPKLNLKDGKLICTPGTYNAGYTLDGVVQGSGTTLFTPSTFTYNLLINSIAQTSLAVTTALSIASWNLPTTPSGAMISCSVTVSANGVTNTDKSTDNASAVSSALSAQAVATAKANTDYSMSQSANSKAYQKALVDNRAKWRSDVEKIRTDYFAERDRIKSLPSTRVTRALASAALKAYTAAQKKSATDYRASQPAAAAARDAANKAALDAKNTAIAKANATYGTFIESIGYGVLIP